VLDSEQSMKQQSVSPYVSLDASFDLDGSDATSVSTADDGVSSLSSAASTAAMRLQRPTSLPDTDDTSMKQVYTYLNQYEQDLRWSTLSDLFFIVGGFGYVILSFFDVLAPASGNKPIYVLFNVCAPTVYLFNAAIDLRWAGSIRERKGKRKQMKGYWNDWRLMIDPPIDSDDCNALHQDNTERDGNASQANDCERQLPLTDERVMPWYKRLRRHAAHRRATFGAATFGIAAAIGLAAVLIEYVDDERLDFAGISSLEASMLLDTVSVHVYAFSAVVCLSGKRQRPTLNSSVPASSPWTSPEVLEDVGDLLFFVGSVVDLVRCDYAFDDGHHPAWSMFSSLLWLLDAMLYLRSDYVMFESLKQIEDEGRVMC
jgi:hypothetical protein